MNTETIAAALAALGAGVIGVVRLLSMRQDPPLPGCTHLPVPLPPAAPTGARGWLGRLRRALVQLWRHDPACYDQPWILLFGEPGAGTSSLASSVSATLRAAPHRRPEGLDMDGAASHAFAQGVLIDVDGALPAAPAGSPGARRWRAVLDRLEAVRPERALDGIVLTVAARTISSSSLSQLELAGAHWRHQLSTITDRVGFALPVYVVVTATDSVDGYADFCGALPAHMRRGMFGWSAPALPDGGAAPEWTDAAFDALAAGMRECQLASAAGASDAGADGQVLFPHHLAQLHSALTPWLAAAFAPGQLPGELMLRGIYFTGCLAPAPAGPPQPRTDVAFVDELVSEKVLAERHLARPTDSAIWSRNRLLRLLQGALLCSIAALAAVLLFASLQLWRQFDDIGRNLTAIVRAAPAETAKAAEACLDQAQMFAMLDQVAHVRLNVVYLPWSGLDRRVRDESAVITARRALEATVLPALRCHLESKAAALRPSRTGAAPDATLAPAEAIARSRQTLLEYLDRLLLLEKNGARLASIANDRAPANPEAATRALSDLLLYVYGAPFPANPPGTVARVSPAASSAVAGWYAWIVELFGATPAAPAVAVKPAPAAAPQPDWRIDRDGALYQAMRHVHYPSGPLIDKELKGAVQREIELLLTDLAPSLERQVSHGEALLADLNRDSASDFPPLRERASSALNWLLWIQSAWLGSSSERNPCQSIAGALQARAADAGHYQYRLTSGASAAGDGAFSASACYTAAMKTLQRLNTPLHGPLVSLADNDDVLSFNPSVLPELAGLRVLVQQDFMRADAAAPFSCPVRRPVFWQAGVVDTVKQLAAAYQRFAGKQGIPLTAGTNGERAMFDRLARHQVELAMNAAMNQAAQPASDAQTGAPLDGNASADMRLSQSSARFAAVSPALLEVLGLYRQLGFAGSATMLYDCLRGYASEELRQTRNLVNTSRLYAPPAGPPNGPLFDLGGPAAAKDFLARQVGRAQVLSNYAQPFAQFLQISRSLSDARRADPQPVPYWIRTISELNQYVVANDSSGTVGALHDFIGKQLLVMDSSNCKRAVEAIVPNDAVDLFSERRREIAELAVERCGKLNDAQLLQEYRDLAARFDELGGNFPFGPVWAGDADAARVRSFFVDNRKQLSSLRSRADERKEERWQARRAFLAQLDDMAPAMRAMLGSAAVPLNLKVVFNIRPQDALGTDQLVNWTLASGGITIGRPNRPPDTLDWRAGQPLNLGLEWATLSPWRPQGDTAQPELRATGTMAEFGFGGNWGLLRLLTLHTAGAGDAGSSDGSLEFRVPLVPRDAAPGTRAAGLARVYLSVAVSIKDAKTGAPAALALPLRFPQSAPR